ncbi:hypothetical protein DPMN_066072 [Dreissena polymorpha]|uniref:C1q domain-containing protein n=1 Tax=Dreissena polymorpha TaxID=45954 RepID=A0A9D4BSJ8_DREPO|nr:hypothetical protein DPMN_066072 [Dreissena polymorpha]
MSSCADVFIELLSTKNKLLSADTWMMRRRRFKKRNIAEKVNGTCKQGKRRRFQEKITAATQADNKRCCRDVLTACDRKEIQQLCLDSSHETYIAVTVPQLECMAVVSNVARARLWTEEDCQQRDWIQDTNFTAGRVFSTTRRVRFTTRRAVTTRRLCGNNTTKNCTARRAVTERRLNMQHKTKNANIQTLMWTPSSQYIRVAYSCDKTAPQSIARDTHYCPQALEPDVGRCVCESEDAMAFDKATNRLITRIVQIVRFKSARAGVGRRLLLYSDKRNGHKHIRIVEENSQQQLVCKHYNAILQFDTNVFCSLTTQDAQEIAFTDGSLTTADRIVFTTVLANVGGAYDPSTGTFNCPTTGYTCSSKEYCLLQFHTLAPQDKSAWLELYHNQQYIASVYGKTTNEYAIAGNSVILQVNKGGQVYIRAVNARFGMGTDLYGQPDEI